MLAEQYCAIEMDLLRRCRSACQRLCIRLQCRRDVAGAAEQVPQVVPGIGGVWALSHNSLIRSNRLLQVTLLQELRCPLIRGIQCAVPADDAAIWTIAA